MSDFLTVTTIIINSNYLPEIDSLRRRNLNSWSNNENAIRWKRYDVVERPIPNIYDLQHVTRLGSEQGSLLDDEELLLLRCPQQPPRRRQRIAGGHRAGARGSHRIDGLDDCGALRGVALGPDATVLVGDEGEEVLLGGSGLGDDGGAGEAPVRVARAGEFGGEGVGKKEFGTGHEHGWWGWKNSIGSVWREWTWKDLAGENWVLTREDIVGARWKLTLVESFQFSLLFMRVLNKLYIYLHSPMGEFGWCDWEKEEEIEEKCEFLGDFLL